jgi:hypothetical protein
MSERYVTRDAYLGNSNIKGSNVQVTFTPEQIEEYVKCSEDPSYFIENYIKIVNLDEGLIDFKMYDFQKDMVNAVHKNRFTIAKFPRQTGKSVTIISYFLHYILFNENMNVAILANKQDIARELLSRLKTAYENLPKWLQQGVVEWNKGSILLENGSKVKASATSSSAIRGGSFNAILLDEFAYVPPHIADEFYSSVYPTISSGQDTKIIIVSTPNGLNMYYKIWNDAMEKRNSFVPIEVHWNKVPGRDEEWKRKQIANTSEHQFRVEFECDFIGSTNTLIHPTKLKTLSYKQPIYTNDQGVWIHEYPIEDHLYTMVIDTSRGQSIDYHAFVIIDITQTPYKIVSSFKNNEISPIIYPNLIYPMAKKYNDAYILVEVNDIGSQVADILHTEFEYDNILSSSFRGRKGQMLDGGFGATASSFGVRTTKAVKRLGCSIMKTMIEDDKILIEDYRIIQELVTFINRKTTYEADTGYNDDLVMCLVLFSWLSSQEYFKDLTNLDMRKNLFTDKIKQLEEEVVPFGFIDSMENRDMEVDSSGTTWYTVY